mgnify:CR=1 FL=1
MNKHIHGGVKETVIPEFKTDAEFINWAFQQQAEALTNLAKRIEQVEMALQKIPPPGADMIKYKIPGTEEYSNLKQLLDNLFDRLNTLEEKISK